MSGPPLLASRPCAGGVGLPALRANRAKSPEIRRVRLARTAAPTRPTWPRPRRRVGRPAVGAVTLRAARADGDRHGRLHLPSATRARPAPPRRRRGAARRVEARVIATAPRRRTPTRRRAFDDGSARAAALDAAGGIDHRRDLVSKLDSFSASRAGAHRGQRRGPARAARGRRTGARRGPRARARCSSGCRSGPSTAHQERERREEQKAIDELAILRFAIRPEERDIVSVIRHLDQRGIDRQATPGDRRPREPAWVRTRS